MKKLAKEGGLLELYDFFYSATSKWVHFSPQILMRMGWSDTKGPDAVFKFSTSHFSNYYAGFNAVYSTYLFGLFHEFFGKELNLESKMDKYVVELGHWISSLSRWPELLTFEEMNIEKPNIILYEVMQMIEEDKKKKPRTKK